MNGAPINSGMGTCGLCGLIGVWTGWVSPSEEAVAKGAAAMSRPTSVRTSLMFIASSRDREGALILIDVVQVQDTQIPGDQDH